MGSGVSGLDTISAPAVEMALCSILLAFNSIFERPKLHIAICEVSNLGNSTTCPLLANRRSSSRNPAHGVSALDHSNSPIPSGSADGTMHRRWQLATQKALPRLRHLFLRSPRRLDLTLERNGHHFCGTFMISLWVGSCRYEPISLADVAAALSCATSCINCELAQNSGWFEPLPARSPQAQHCATCLHTILRFDFTTNLFIRSSKTARIALSTAAIPDKRSARSRLS